jgi:hypothetical protein
MEEKNTSPIHNSPDPKKSNVLSIVLGITGVFLVILIIGIGALLASHTWNPSWNPFKKAPDWGIQKIFKK